MFAAEAVHLWGGNCTVVPRPESTFEAMASSLIGTRADVRIYRRSSAVELLLNHDRGRRPHSDKRTSRDLARKTGPRFRALGRNGVLQTRPGAGISNRHGRRFRQHRVASRTQGDKSKPSEIHETVVTARGAAGFYAGSCVLLFVGRGSL
jgi:hypothetical protein